MKALFAISCICLAFCACDNHSKNSGPVRINQSRAQSTATDWETTVRVKAAILTSGSVLTGNKFVSVSTTNGTVTLTGSVSSKEQMKKIVRIVEDVEGVDRVDNQISVSND